MTGSETVSVSYSYLETPRQTQYLHLHSSMHHSAAWRPVLVSLGRWAQACRSSRRSGGRTERRVAGRSGSPVGGGSDATGAEAGTGTGTGEKGDEEKKGVIRGYE